LEFFNPGGSLKDRVGKRTVKDLEEKGLIKKGYTLIEATSGNCGIGIAMLSAVKGYKAIITMSDKMSLEKKYILNSMGAECIRTPADAPFNTPESHIGVAYRLNKEIETSRFLDQYSDDSNALVNYDETAEELWNDLDGKVDYVVMTTGTGGTITGIARKFKERNPNIKIVGVDPVGSQMAMPKSLNEKKYAFKVEGIGYDFVPKNLDQNSVDIWYKCEDKDSFIMARRLIREEGLLVGGSAGSAVWAALDVAKTLPEDKRVCVIVCDGIRNYMSKFISDDWMIENEYYKESDVEKANDDMKFNRVFGVDLKISDLIENLKLIPSKFVDDTQTIEEAIKIMKENNLDYLPILSKQEHHLIGYTSIEYITEKLIVGYLKSVDNVKRVNSTEFKKLSGDEYINRLSRAFVHKHFVCVNHNENVFTLFPKHLIEFMKNKK
jgi:cystathionine beta-synthase